MTAPQDTSRRTLLKAGAALGALTTAGCTGFPTTDEGGSTPNGNGSGETGGNSSDGFEIEEVTEGLGHPWGIAFLPNDSRLLVTERLGRLTLVDREDGTLEPVDGTPEVYTEGQGGLLDVTLHPEFPDESWIYLTYAAVNDAGESATHLGRGRIDADEPRLADFETLHVAEPFVDSDGHFGSRAVFDEEGALYVTTGDRQSKEFGPDHVAQDTSNELGATLRLAPDGSIPDDNPFVDDPEARDSIFSYGHRNAQGMTVRPGTDELWQSEHGEGDGDELNVIEARGNYGWPVATYACEYGTEEPLGDPPDEREDTVEPVYYWECGTGGYPPAGMTFYDGGAFPDWQGDLFVGNLGAEYLGRFTVEGRNVSAAGSLLDGRGWRIRDVEVAPDTGHLYVLVDAEDAPLVRLVPE